DDGEIDLALRQRPGARYRAIGLDRPKTDIRTILDKGLRQHLHDLDVVAVDGADRDLQRHRLYGKLIGGDDRADDGKHTGKRYQHCPARRGTRRRRRRRTTGGETLSHLSRYRSYRLGSQSLEAQFHLAGTVMVIL